MSSEIFSSPVVGNVILYRSHVCKNISTNFDWLNIRYSTQNHSNWIHFKLFRNILTQSFGINSFYLFCTGFGIQTLLDVIILAVYWFDNSKPMQVCWLYGNRYYISDVYSCFCGMWFETVLILVITYWYPYNISVLVECRLAEWKLGFQQANS